ncbi:beta-agarase [Candidatus Epulonipiscium viviparus]|uniref:beta-agarase n=1 Tax=Candidatus Epulonipiscium viviparus TaxID=420336 RepID=UPI00273815B6|nr:beta-agarase [Candidatus Epulopiscium viviparus]
MKLYKKLLVPILFITGIFTSISAAELPPSIAAEKAAYDTFPAIIAKYNPTMLYQVNDNEERIKIINIPIEPFTLANGESKIIEIPADIMRVAFAFERFTVYGSGFKTMTSIQAIDPVEGNTGSVHAGWFSNTAYQIKDDSFEVDPIAEIARGDAAFSGYKLQFNGPVEVKSLNIMNESGTSMVFDTTAWEVIGGDKPVLDGLAVNVDATHRLSLEGNTDLEEDKFKRLYSGVNAPDTFTTAEYFTKKNFIPGRQIHKFGPSYETGSYKGHKLREDPDKPGYSDLSFFDNFVKDSAAVSNMDKYFPNINYVTCFDNWPSWTYEGKDLGRGTPDPEHFEAAAELAAAYVVATNRVLDGRGPKYIEVKNESTLTSEWSHHTNSEPGYGWKVLADFHNIMADTIHEWSPETLVGGASAAFMNIDGNNFASAKEHLNFLDQTKDHLDYYSYHFYESKNLVLNDPDSAENYGGYLTGRLDADLDLIYNHMLLTDNVKPILITETGTLHSGPTDPDYWIKLKNHNSYMIRYMNHADKLDMVTQFILPAIWWNKGTPETLWQYGPDGKLIPTQEEGLTKMKYFLEIWDEYSGELLPISTNALDSEIYAHSVQEGNVVYVAMTNMNPQRAYVDINLELDDEKIDKIERTTMYLDMGELHFVDNEPIDSLDNIFMHVEETSIIKITLNQNPNITETINKNTYYGDKTLQPTGVPAVFNINASTDGVESSILRVAFGKTNGFSTPLNVSINGYSLAEVDLSYSDKPGNFFDYVEFELPAGVLKDQNEISVSINETGGHVSTVSIINHSK